MYCKFKNASDKVPHGQLLHKIRNYGVTRNILGWITDFLNNRTQQVVVNSAKSGYAPVTSGIPQGSVLGPLLFVIYINDLPDVVDKDSFVYLFADDTKIFRKIQTDRDRNILQQDIDNLLKWSNDWLLKFHPDKCVCMGVGYSSEVPDFYDMDGTVLKGSDCERDLGIHFDRYLKFDYHINTIINKANRTLGIIRKTFDYLDKDIFCLLFKGLIRSQLEYAAPVWSPHLMKHIEALENVQRRATKLVPGMSQLSYAERLKALKLPTLTYRRLRGDMITVFKIVHMGFDENIRSMLPKNTSGLRGHDKKLFVEGSKRDIRKYNFTMRVRKIWNSLPDRVVNAKDVINFERELDNYWSNQDLLYEDYKASIKI